MKRAGGGFDASYNAQTAVDEAAHIIIAAELTNVGSDAAELPKMLEAVVCTALNLRECATCQQRSADKESSGTPGRSENPAGTHLHSARQCLERRGPHPSPLPEGEGARKTLCRADS